MKILLRTMCQCTRMIELKDDPGDTINFEFAYNTAPLGEPHKILNLTRKFKKARIEHIDPENEPLYMYEETPEVENDK